MKMTVKEGERFCWVSDKDGKLLMGDGFTCETCGDMAVVNTREVSGVPDGVKRLVIPANLPALWHDENSGSCCDNCLE